MASVLIGILHVDGPPWDEIAELGQATTWVPEADTPDVSVLYVYGKRVNSLFIELEKFHEFLRWRSRLTSYLVRSFDGVVTQPLKGKIPTASLVTHPRLSVPVLEVDLPDTFMTMPLKEKALIQYFLTETEDDYLLMTTSSSYLRISQLTNFLNESPRSGLYAGARVCRGNRPFASGANRVLSRDVAERLLSRHKDWRLGYMDDVGMGDLLQRLGYSLTHSESLSISSHKELMALDQVDLEGVYHIRVKSLDPSGQRNDVKLMKELHYRLGLMETKIR